MTTKELDAAVAALDHDWARLVTVGVTYDLALAAGQLAATHGIRGSDAVHLAAFEYLLSLTDDDVVQFSCADERLTRAARALG